MKNGQPTSEESDCQLDRIIGDYKILAKLGSGRMGIVYKAQHATLGNVVALKLIMVGAQIQKIENRDFWQSLAMARLNRRGIVSVLDAGSHNGQCFLAMDYVEGKSLSKLFCDSPAPAKLAAEITRQLAESVHYAHGMGFLHRDLNPTTVLLTTEGVPWITGFGLATRLWPGERVATLSKIKAGQIVGTECYMSPECALGENWLPGPATDVYGLGAVLYFLLTSRAPFVGESPAATAAQVIKGHPVSARELNRDVPRDLETICLKCLEMKMSHRYRTAEALARDLSAFLEDRPIAARPIGLLSKIFRSRILSVHNNSGRREESCGASGFAAED